MAKDNLYKPGENNVSRGYITREQAVEFGRKGGQTISMKKLFDQILQRGVTASDAILNCKREMTVQEAVLLKLFEAAFAGKEWAIKEIKKEGMHDGKDKVEVEEKLSPAAEAILEDFKSQGAMIDITPDK